MENWQPLAATTMVGSMPHQDREKVIELILRTFPEVPVWPQLPFFPPEQMMIQCLEGLPGTRVEQGQVLVEVDAPPFEQELIEFYEAYLEVEEGGGDLEGSRFAMGPETGISFFQFLERWSEPPLPSGR